MYSGWNTTLPILFQRKVNQFIYFPACLLERLRIVCALASSTISLGFLAASTRLKFNSEMSLGNSSDGTQWRGENWRQRQFPSTMYTHMLWVCLKILLNENFLAFFLEHTKAFFIFSLQSSLIHGKHIFIFRRAKGERNRTEENLLHLIWAENWRENWIIKISKVQASENMLEMEKLLSESDRSAAITTYIKYTETLLCCYLVRSWLDFLYWNFVMIEFLLRQTWKESIDEPTNTKVISL